MRITNATIYSLAAEIRAGLSTAGLGPDDALATEVKIGFNEGDVLSHLPTVAVDEASNQGFPIGLGPQHIGAGRSIDIAIHVWGHNRLQARELADTIWEICLFKDSIATFQIKDYGQNPPIQIATGQTSLDENGSLVPGPEDGTEGYARYVVVVPVLTHQPG
jgi:hypothetical protein